MILSQIFFFLIISSCGRNISFFIYCSYVIIEPPFLAHAFPISYTAFVASSFSGRGGFFTAYDADAVIFTRCPAGLVIFAIICKSAFTVFYHVNQPRFPIFRAYCHNLPGQDYLLILPKLP